MSTDPFGDIPLFRELQRVLSSSQGPVNYEIARQVAVAVATDGGAEPAPDPEVKRAYAEAVGSAAPLVSGFTRLGIEEPATSDVITRAGWVSSTLKAWGWLLERLAGRFTQAFNEDEGGALGGTGPMLGQVIPLLMGLQTGALIGALAKETVGRYDLPLPGDRPEDLLLVGRNARAVAEDYVFDEADFRSWVALRDVTQHLVFTNHPWLEKYARSVFTELIDSIEVDMGDIERRLMELQSGGMESIEGMNASDALPVVTTERHRFALKKVEAFISVVQGYAHHATTEIAAETIRSAGKIEEGIARHAASLSEGQTALGGILGLTLERSIVTSGATFCAAVINLKGIYALNRVWEAPDNLPTTDEITDPFQWMERLFDE